MRTPPIVLTKVINYRFRSAWYTHRILNCAVYGNGLREGARLHSGRFRGESDHGMEGFRVSDAPPNAPIDAQLKERIKAALLNLSPEEREVVSDRFGLVSGTPMTLDRLVRGQQE